MTTNPPGMKFEESRLAAGLLRAYAALIFVTLPIQIWSDLQSRQGPTALGVVSAVVVGLAQFVAILHLGSWFRNAYSRLSVVGVRTRYTPAMALVLFFVPFANLFRPSELIAELYAGFEPTRLRQASGRRPGGSRAAAFWWYGLLASSIASDIATAISLRDADTESKLVRLAFFILAQVLAASAALGATRFVRDISELQRRCAILLRLDKKLELSEFLEDETFRPTRRLSHYLGGLLFASAILQLPFVYAWLPTTTDENPIGMMLGPFALLRAIIVVVTITVFLIWVHRTVSNLQRVSEFSMSPGFAAGGFLIPVFNLVHPWIVIQKMWRFLDDNDEISEDRRAGPLTVPQDSARRSILVDLWWMSALMQFGAASCIQWFRRWPEVSPEGERAAVLATLFFSVLTVVLLQQVVAGIARKMEWHESRAMPVKENAVAEVGPAPQATPRRATWKEVLLPIAASVDDGLREDRPEARREREKIERERDALREIEIARTFRMREVLLPTRPDREELSEEALEELREQVALKRAREAQAAIEDSQRETLDRAREAEKKIQRARQRVQTSAYASARVLTSTVRVLLLLALFVGFGECVYVFGAFALMGVVRLSPLLLFGAMACLLLIGAMICGLPSWLVLSQWAVAQVRNGNALGVLATDPFEGRLRILSLREPDLFRDLFVASGAPFSDAGFRRWTITLRMVQTAPGWLAIAFVAAPIVAILATGVFGITLLLCLTETANYVRSIDSGFVRMHRDRQNAMRTAPAVQG